MNVVVDASVAVEYLLRTALGRRIAAELEAADLFAPELLDVEVLAVLRRAVTRKALDQKRAATAIADLCAWPLERIGHVVLAERAWSHRNNVSAYDAFYVAAAHHVGGRVMTADGPLARAPRLGIVVENVRW